MLKRAASISSIAALFAASNFLAAAEQARTCGTPAPSSEQLMASQKLLESAADLAPSFPKTGIVIPVAFHVVHSANLGDDQNYLGNVDAADIQKQIKVLNDAYIGSGFSFALQSIDRTINETWFKDCYHKDKRMKSALAVNPATTLNVYTCHPVDTPYGPLLGWATFPQSYTENDTRHGVVLEYGSLPKGNVEKYNLGITLVHEVGHYLGLFHTFENGCRSPGDGVADTAAEKYPGFGCPLTSDSCPGALGKDPVINYMDYSEDACMKALSLGQIRLAQRSIAKWRPSLLPPV